MQWIEKPQLTTSQRVRRKFTESGRYEVKLGYASGVGRHDVVTGS